MIGRLAVSFPPGAGGLSRSEVEAVLSAIDEQKMSQGRIGAQEGRNLVTAVRSGAVQWLAAKDVGEAVFSHLYTLAIVANRERRWDFKLEGVTPNLQATRYSSDGGQHYSWHMDWGLGPTRSRKIGLVAHLSEPGDFDGGRLQLTAGSRPVDARQERGTVTVFPAFVMHRVTPVTRGVRLGAVLWAVGPSFS
ncbi:MAG TPA: 2OG-Fe(II) oxygenase [Acidimicrobiales bacterium]|nr:2OG-Fe(II) oxygenase [Acidimicrobiales bacterium]